MNCKCGIPNCQGHRVVDGKILINGHPKAHQSPQLERSTATQREWDDNDKITSADLRAKAQELIAAGKMPPLEDVLKAVAGVRKKYRSQILDARGKEGAEEE